MTKKNENFCFCNYANINNLQRLSKIIEKKVKIRGRHTKAHQEQVNESTMFHLFSGETLSLAQFLETYGND